MTIKIGSSYLSAEPSELDYEFENAHEVFGCFAALMREKGKPRETFDSITKSIAKSERTLQKLKDQTDLIKKWAKGRSLESWKIKLDSSFRGKLRRAIKAEEAECWRGEQMKKYNRMRESVRASYLSDSAPYYVITDVLLACPKQPSFAEIVELAGVSVFHFDLLADPKRRLAIETSVGWPVVTPWLVDETRYEHPGRWNRLGKWLAIRCVQHETLAKWVYDKDTDPFDKQAVIQSEADDAWVRKAIVAACVKRSSQHFRSWHDLIGHVQPVNMDTFWRNLVSLNRDGIIDIIVDQQAVITRAGWAYAKANFARQPRVSYQQRKADEMQQEIIQLKEHINGLET